MGFTGLTLESASPVRFASTLAEVVRRGLLSVLVVGGPLSGWLVAAEPEAVGSVGRPICRSAPTPPPVEARTVEWLGPSGQAMVGLALYSIGSPADEEQLYVELINQARLNPPLEAERLRRTTDPNILEAYGYFGVDLNLMRSQISGLAATSPLSINERLTAAARSHSEDMFRNDFQGHTGSDGSSPSSRIEARGYSWSLLGENVFAYAHSVEYGHAGFEVDWGFGPGGMQSPPGHRLNLHNGDFREIGVGLVIGTNSHVGPQLVTQDLASRSDLPPFITGVVYYDLDGNGFYGVGEGLGGVEVTVAGSDHYAITARSGGYSVPAPRNASLTVRFAAAWAPVQTRQVAVDTGNVKADHVLVYAPPVTTGPNPAWVGLSNRFTFSAVAGADAYEWERMRRSPFTAVEGAESGLTNVIPTVSPGYEVIVRDVRDSGTRSFHLAQPEPEDQILLLKRLLRPGTNSVLTFASRLGSATTNQVAIVQVSTNGGDQWHTVWSRVGTGYPGQSSFSDVNVPLGVFAGTFLKLRCLYEYTDGIYYPQTSTGSGWYIDGISVTHAEELTAPVVAGVDSVSEPFFLFVPDAPADHTLRVRACASGRSFPWGPVFLTCAALAPLQIRFCGPPLLAGGRATLEFELSGGVASSFTVEIAPSPAGPWVRDASATLQPLVAGSRFQATATVGDGRSRFYRVVAP